MIGPRTLFGRTALVIALVSFAFHVFTIAVITWFALMPLGRNATSDQRLVSSATVMRLTTWPLARCSSAQRT